MDLQGARDKVTQTSQVANDYAAGSNTIQDVLKQKVNEIYDYNKDIVEPLDKATASYMSSPATAREKYQDVFNPFSKEKLVSQSVSNAMIPMLSLANIFGTRQGTIADTINAGTNAYNAQGTMAANNANIAQTEYNNLLKEYETTQKSSGPDYGSFFELWKKYMGDESGSDLPEYGDPSIYDDDTPTASAQPRSQPVTSIKPQSTWSSMLQGNPLNKYLNIKLPTFGY